MGNKTWKILKWFTFIIIILIAGFFISIYLKGSDGSLTGEQYLKAQEKYMAEFESYADDVDNIMTLYLEDSISEEDFLNHLQIFQEELNIMKAAHDEDANKYPVKTGTNTYYTKRGCEAVNECYDIFQNILTMLQNNYADKEALSYKYIAYHQDIINALSDYMTARDATFGSVAEESKE